MSEPRIEIHATTKVVGEGYYEFSYAYGQAPDPAPAIAGKVVPTGSSLIAPGLAVPVETPSSFR